jgi:uncharacterized protein YjiS (DUF1127 family)
MEIELMSMVSNASTGTHEFAGFRPGVRLLAAIKRCWYAYSERRARQRAAARLRSWSDSQLKDIGISRGQIEFAVREVGGRRELRRRMS